MRVITWIREFGLARLSALLGSIAAVIAIATAGLGLFDDDNDDTQRSDEPAQAVATTYVQNFHAGDFGAIWDALHPAEQDLYSRDEFVRCRQEQGATAGLHSLKVIDVHAGATASAPVGDVIGASGPSGAQPDYPGIDEGTITTVVVQVTLDTSEGRTTTEETVYMAPTDAGFEVAVRA